MARILNQETTFSPEILAGWGIKPESLSHPITTETIQQIVARIRLQQDPACVMADLQTLQTHIEKIKGRYDDDDDDDVRQKIFDHYTDLWLIVFDTMEALQEIETPNTLR